jgi:plasmid stability protein
MEHIESPLATTTLTVRNVERQLKEKLRVRAARHGQSMEAELRQILRETLADEGKPELNLAEAIRRRFAPFGGVELEPHPRVPDREPPRFDE